MEDDIGNSDSQSQAYYVEKRRNHWDICPSIMNTQGKSSQQKMGSIQKYEENMTSQGQKSCKVTS